MRVAVATQLSSQVFPPSSAYDCSKRHDVGVTSFQPFRTGFTTDVPSYSSQVVSPDSGRRSREMWVFQFPISKSKSCSPFGRAGPREGSRLIARREMVATCTAATLNAAVIWPQYGGP